MTISKTSFRYISNTYAALHSVFWEFPIKLSEDPKNGWQYKMPSRDTFLLMKWFNIFNILLRIFTTAFNITCPLFVPGIKHVEMLDGCVRSGANLITIGCMVLVVIKSELQKIQAFLNGMYLFNRKLAAHFKRPEFVECDGIEPLLRGVKYVTIGAMIMSPVVMTLAWSGLGENFVAPQFTLGVATRLFGYRYIPMVFLIVGGVHMFCLEILLSTASALDLFVATNFIYQWLRIHGQDDLESEHPKERRERQILYRAHQVWVLFLQDWTRQLIPMLVAATCFITICAFTSVIKFNQKLGPVVSIFVGLCGICCLTVQKIAIGMVNKFMAASQEYIDKGKQTAARERRQVDKKFFRACQPIRWNIAMIPLSQTIFVSILNNVIVVRIMDILILLEEH